MFSSRLIACTGISLALLAAAQSPVLAKAAPGPSVLVIGVDHLDAANQHPELNRFFEYTDFFSRDVTVHRGEVLDFRFAPGAFHIVGLAKSQTVARKVYPIVSTDADDGPAIGTGKPKIELGPSNFSIFDGNTSGGGTIGTDPSGQTPPPCGEAGRSPAAVCTFSGGTDIESSGPIAGFGPQGPMSVDWSIKIDAVPGEYDFLCFLHPGMQGHVRVLDPDDAVTTQASNDEDANEQFRRSRAQALDAEADANVVRFSGEEPGERTYQASVGVGAADGKVNVLEMLPQKLNLDKGDRVRFSWKSPNEAHVVAFPTGSPALPAPFGFDCGSTFQSPGPGAPCIEPGGKAPESIGDPGNAPSGTLLTLPTVLVDSGVLAGAGYHLSPSLRVWSVATNGATATGAFQYQCTIHDFMHGTLNVTN